MYLWLCACAKKSLQVEKLLNFCQCLLLATLKHYLLLVLKSHTDYTLKDRVQDRTNYKINLGCCLLGNVCLKQLGTGALPSLNLKPTADALRPLYLKCSTLQCTNWVALHLWEVCTFVGCCLATKSFELV